MGLPELVRLLLCEGGAHPGQIASPSQDKKEIQKKTSKKATLLPTCSSMVTVWFTAKVNKVGIPKPVVKDFLGTSRTV